MIAPAFIYWDPNPAIFVVPYLRWPILWYGALFALGFALGFPLFVSLLTRYFHLKSRTEDPVLLRKEAVFTLGDFIPFFKLLWISFIDLRFIE